LMNARVWSKLGSDNMDFKSVDESSIFASLGMKCEII
jgi:hypothetical protein